MLRVINSLWKYENVDYSRRFWLIKLNDSIQFKDVEFWWDLWYQECSVNYFLLSLFIIF